jgi:hypothetical protein
VPVVALGEPTSVAGAEATDAVKVSVWAPGAEMILMLSKLATPAVVERTSVPETVPEPVALVTVIEYREDRLFAAVRAFENSSRSVASGTRLKTSPRVLFSVAVVGTLDKVSELGIPYSGDMPSTVAGVKLPEV